MPTTCFIMKELKKLLSLFFIHTPQESAINSLFVQDITLDNIFGCLQLDGPFLLRGEMSQTFSICEKVNYISEPIICGANEQN